MRLLFLPTKRALVNSTDRVREETQQQVSGEQECRLDSDWVDVDIVTEHRPFKVEFVWRLKGTAAS